MLGVNPLSTLALDELPASTTPVVEAVGSSSGTGTATGVGQAQVNSVGSSAGISEATGVGQTYAYTVGSSSGSSSVNGVGDDAGAITPEPESIEYLGGMPESRKGHYDFLNPPERNEKHRPIKPAKKPKGLNAGRQREQDKSRPYESDQSALSGEYGIDALSRAIDALRIAEAERMRMAAINNAVQTGLIGLAVDMDRMAKESEQAEEEQAILQFLFDM